MDALEESSVDPEINGKSSEGSSSDSNKCDSDYERFVAGVHAPVPQQFEDCDVPPCQANHWMSGDRQTRDTDAGLNREVLNQGQSHCILEDQMPMTDEEHRCHFREMTLHQCQLQKIPCSHEWKKEQERQCLHIAKKKQASMTSGVPAQLDSLPKDWKSLPEVSEIKIIKTMTSMVMTTRLAGSQTSEARQDP